MKMTTVLVTQFLQRDFVDPIGPHDPFHDHKTDQASSTYCKERSLTIEMESLRTMGREWAGPRIGNTTHWLENGGTSPAVRSRSIVRQE
jgi:hypothetical protein